MKSTELRQLIRESINEYIRDIDEAGTKAGLQAKIEATEGAISKREKMANMEGIDEAYHEMLDKGKMKEIGNEVKALKKSLDKLKKQLDKLNSKGTKTEKPESEDKEIVDEVEIDETFPESGAQLEEDNLSGLEDDAEASMGDLDEMDIYEMLHMQKLAGIISETEYKQKIEILNEDKLVLSNYAKQLYSLFKKAGATPLIVVGKNSTSPDVKNFNISIVVTANDELMVGIKGDKATAEKYSNLVAKQFPDLQLKGDIKIGTGWGGEKDSYADLILIPKTTKKGGDINPNQRPNTPKPTV
jgi:hypothetical protein